MGGEKKIVDRRFTREDANEKIRIHQIMLKYRPIAPRPVTAESSCCSMTCATSKRKYVRVKNKDKDKDKASSDKKLVRVKKKDKGKSDSDMNLDKTMTVRKVQDCNNFIECGTTGCRDVKNRNFFMNNVIIPPPKYVRDADVSVAVIGDTGCCDFKNFNFLMSNVIIPRPKYLHDADVSVAVSGGTGCCDVKNCNFLTSNVILPPPKYLDDTDVSVTVSGGTGCCDVKNCNFLMSNVNIPSPKYLHDTDLSVAVRGGKVMESWITTESLTCANEVGRWLGYADDEIRKNLEKDSSPGFISNCFDEVEWVNLAYRRIGDPRLDGGGPPPDVVVWLAIKFEKMAPVKDSRCFSCRVRVEYEILNRKSQMTVPCDVWKMECGGFAWRLDVGAALCLGRIS